MHLKRAFFRVCLLSISCYLGIQTFEVYLALRQRTWEQKKQRIFGIVEPREATEAKLGLKSAVTGGFYRYFPELITPDFPIGAEPHETYLGYNEGLGYPIIYTDRNGFNNEDKWWDEIPDVILIGDSFTDCQHLVFEDTFVSQLRSKGHKAVSLGVCGSGPYLQLAALKTYRGILHGEASLVIWTYYEGNDLYDAIGESKTPLLKDCIQDEWHHSANLNRLADLRKSHKYGVESKFWKTLTLQKTRDVLEERRGFPNGVAAYQKALDAALKYHPHMILVRIKRYGVAYDKAWNALKAPIKLDLPALPEYYSSSVVSSHLNKLGYAKLVELVEPYVENL